MGASERMLYTRSQVYMSEYIVSTSQANRPPVQNANGGIIDTKWETGSTSIEAQRATRLPSVEIFSASFVPEERMAVLNETLNFVDVMPNGLRYKWGLLTSKIRLKKAK